MWGCRIDRPGLEVWHWDSGFRVGGPGVGKNKK